MMDVAELYDLEGAKNYDLLNLNNNGITEKTCEFLTDIFHRSEVSTVLDMACGTGAQAIGLAVRGFRVTGSDISPYMVSQARAKAEIYQVEVDFLEQDMRCLGDQKFDAIVALYNAVGHLTSSELQKVIQKTQTLLNTGGLLVFDTFRRASLAKVPTGVFRDLSLRVEDKLITRDTQMVFDTREMKVNFSQVTSMASGFSEAKTIRESYGLSVFNDAEIEHTIRTAGFTSCVFQEGSMFEFPSISATMQMIIAKN